jgi:hypothetical protein
LEAAVAATPVETQRNNLCSRIQEHFKSSSSIHKKGKAHLRNRKQGTEVKCMGDSMTLPSLARRLAFGVLCFALLLSVGRIQAQSGTGTLRGTVTDPSGAAVVGATVTATSSSGQTTTVQSNATGAYEFRGLPAGQYQVTTNATGFQQFQNPAVAVAGGQAKTLDIPLAIQIEQQQVQVNAESQALDVSPENNADAIVIKGSDLDALPDDPDELQADLQALAGPSLGPNGGQMYIDGFTAGELPPKSSIREIRVNSNPFSAEWDSLGYGRIEIITKAGGGTTHGSFFMLGNSKGLNTADPYANGPVPGYYTLQYNGNIGGSLGKNTSYFVSAQQRRINEVELGALYNPTNFSSLESGVSVPNLRIRTQISPQIQYNLSKNNTLTFRYSYSRDRENNDGISYFSDPSQAYNSTSYENSVQVSDTQVFGAKMVMDTRFQFNGEHGQVNPVSSVPEISVASYLTFGGATQGFNSTTTQNYELQNYFTYTSGKHTLMFGARSKDAQNDATELSNSHGTWQFGTPSEFVAAQQQVAAGEQAGTCTPTSGPCVTNSADYPTRFSLTTGTAFASVNLFDIGAFVQDDYRWKQNVTISTGLRFESQTDIPDHTDWAPRVAVAWGVGKTKQGSPAFVLRGGWGIFYNRFAAGNVMTLVRENGSHQLNYIVDNPDFYPFIPAPNSLEPSGLTARYKLGPNFHTPYTMEGAFSVEHQLTRNITLTVNYLNGRGVKQLYTANVNVPNLPNYNSNEGDVFQFTSGGVFRQNVLNTNVVIRMTNRLTLNANYALNYASGTANSIMFWTDPSLDYGRTSFDVRHRLFMGGNIQLPMGFSLSPFITAASGSPYSVSAGNTYWSLNDLGNNRPVYTTAPANGTTVFSLPGVPENVTNDPTNINYNDLAANGIVPINSLTGPGNFTFNLRVAKVFSFGRSHEAASNQNNGQNGQGRGPGGGFGGPGGGEGGRGPGGGGGGRGGFGGGGFGGGRGGFGGRGGTASNHRYTLTLSANARNLLNIVNAGPRVGTDSSILFGRSTSLVAAGATTTYNRQIQLQAIFSF